jgi:hypothetical protein
MRAFFSAFGLRSVARGRRHLVMPRHHGDTGS